MRAKVEVPTKVPTKSVSVAKLTDEVSSLVMKYKYMLGLGSWRTRVEIDSSLDWPAHTGYSYDKLEAVVSVDPAHKEYIDYLVAHEIAHLILAPLVQIRERLLGDKSEEQTDTYRWIWRDAEEYIVHRIALAMGAKMPPAEFWWEADIVDAA